jgi:hypothetical protein
VNGRPVVEHDTVITIDEFAVAAQVTRTQQALLAKAR